MVLGEFRTQEAREPRFAWRLGGGFVPVHLCKSEPEPVAIGFVRVIWHVFWNLARGRRVPGVDWGGGRWRIPAPFREEGRENGFGGSRGAGVGFVRVWMRKACATWRLVRGLGAGMSTSEVKWGGGWQLIPGEFRTQEAREPRFTWRRRGGFVCVLLHKTRPEPFANGFVRVIWHVWSGLAGGSRVPGVDGGGGTRRMTVPSADAGHGFPIRVEPGLWRWLCSCVFARQRPESRRLGFVPAIWRNFHCFVPRRTYFVSTHPG